MEVLIKQTRLIEKILPSNNVLLDNTRFNKYCVSIDIDNSKLIFNGITGELVLVDNILNDDDKKYLISHLNLAIIL